MTPVGATIGDALARARREGVDRLDAQLLLAHILHRPRSWLVANDTFSLDAKSAHEYQAALARRASGEPLAYLTGNKEFYGLTLQVNAHVLVPRPDTEVLVEWAISLLAHELSSIAHPKVADLGTGSGAIALAIKHTQGQVDLHATDISEEALEVAADNAATLGLPITLHLGRWWRPLRGRRFDLVVSNPPYIAADDPHLSALLHEPQSALTPGGDGLSALREIIGEAVEHLEPHGWLLVEHGFDQAAAVGAMLQAAGFCRIQTRLDLGGRQRCTGGQIRMLPA